MIQEPWLIVILSVGAVFVGVGLPLGLSFPYIYSSALQLNLQLTESSAIFKEWSDSPVPIYMDIFMWNWTNAEEFAADNSVIPAFKEIGPFVFSLKTERSNIHWNDNFTVTFSPNRTFMYEPSMSLDLNNTMITTLSPVAAVISYYGRHWPSKFFQMIVNKEVELREQMYKTESAGNWLFYGINDTLLDLIVPLKEVVDLPLNFEKFAWFYGRNQSTTAEGSITLFTGTDDLSKLGVLSAWNGKNQSDSFPGKCGEIGGVTGELIPPLKERPSSFSVFVPDVCSQIALEWAGETTVETVPGWHFTGSPKSFDNGENFPEQSCFCEGECVPSGARNVSICKFNAPAFVSFPHFYQADETYASRIHGMTPNESHQFYLKFEPNTGIPLSVAAQVQVSLLIRKSSFLDLYEDTPEIYIPMLWFREHATITPELAKLANLVLNLPTIGLAVTYTIAVIGLIMVGVSYHFILKRRT